MISETAHSSQTKLIGYDLHVSEQGIGYSNLTPDPRGASGVKKNKKNRPSGGARKTRKAGFLVIFIPSWGHFEKEKAPPEELGKPAKRVSY